MVHRQPQSKLLTLSAEVIKNIESFLPSPHDTFKFGRTCKQLAGKPIKPTQLFPHQNLMFKGGGILSPEMETARISGRIQDQTLTPPPEPADLVVEWARLPDRLDMKFRALPVLINELYLCSTDESSTEEISAALQAATSIAEQIQASIKSLKELKKFDELNELCDSKEFEKCREISAELWSKGFVQAITNLDIWSNSSAHQIMHEFIKQLDPALRQAPLLALAQRLIGCCQENQDPGESDEFQDAVDCLVDACDDLKLDPNDPLFSYDQAIRAETPLEVFENLACLKKQYFFDKKTDAEIEAAFQKGKSIQDLKQLYASEPEVDEKLEKICIHGPAWKNLQNAMKAKDGRVDLERLSSFTLDKLVNQEKEKFGLGEGAKTSLRQRAQLAYGV
jgi:hypothetical protein